ncbi:hypothetical protein CVT24_004521 [Panaeolus cyanescens]|uniref:Midasin n=1 Tax=Panaeolus cyanescens TaxID=181874 RepID=A0A409YBU1_9AGAR|nr:hypothetical protein CVT24_004521 [Panaeolus cyanescens]
MSIWANIHNPLNINLHRQTKRLRSLIPSDSKHLQTLEHVAATHQLLATLSSLLAEPAYTKIVARLYQPILLDLCARWLQGTENIEQKLVALCYLLEVHEELFSIFHLFLQKFYPQGPLALVLHVSSPASLGNQRLHHLLLAYYRTLQVNRELPEDNYWSLEPLSRLIWSSGIDNAVRLLAIRCYAMQSGMGEKERSLLEKDVLGAPCEAECDMEYGQNLDGSPTFVDGWILPVIEVRRVEEERNEIASPGDFYEWDGEDTEEIDATDLCPLTCNLYGVLLVKSTPQNRQDSPLVPTNSSISALRQLGLHLSLRLPTLLTSAPSAGKSLLLSHLARVVHPDQQNQIVTIHLADTSLDPRALLGSYVSSTTHPGNFEWRDGVLVRAMHHGKWVVLEDVDKGSNEVLGVLNPLIESLGPDKWIGGRARIDVPGRGQVVADDRFMIFATRSLLPFKEGFPSATFYGSHKFTEIQVETPLPSELLQIVNTKFSRLAGRPSQAIIQFWTDMCAVPVPSAMRSIGLRELEKYCQRIQGLLGPDFHLMDTSEDEIPGPTLSQIFTNPSLREDMYLEARDVFFGSGGMSSSTENYLKQLATVAAFHHGLDSERQAWVLEGKVPSLELQKDANGQTKSLAIGSTRLYAQPSSQAMSNSTRPFALHRPALLLLSRISKAITHNEPILLTGETGTGKTSVITHLASLLNHPLISLNLSHQTESSDLIGGLKPIDARIPGSALQEKFMTLFGATFSRKKNEKFATEVRKAVNEQKWKRAAGLWKESVRLALERFHAKSAVQDSAANEDRESNNNTPRKRRKMDTPESTSIALWSNFLQEVEGFEKHHVQGQGKLAFGFIEGPLVKAIRTGQWILLDEVNLASAETLECISSLLHGPTASITLTEQGALEPVPRHPDFRLFACMNPATDVGKKDLPPNIRSRFTEIDVPPPDNDKETLLAIISQYIGHIALSDKGLIMDVAEFYRAVKAVAQSRQIADGSNHRPHFSMRTLTRALTFASDTASTYGLRRSVWEGCLMAFTMALDKESAKVVMGLAQKHLLAGVRNPASLLSKEPSAPKSGEYVKFGPYYLEMGPLECNMGEDYIMTPSVHQKLIDLARIILTRRFPVLIEGPTSSGKTSSVEYLAKRTGHKFVRINNHEHTDIQEYIGSYVSDPVTGKLVFKDGLLVQALRDGSWIVLDELNLAPSDVLEALNRLLDDNRELVIPETHEVVRPHPHFMLFATQNPPGLYAGRKVLSRAFRNRFLEVHFDDVPQDELETILCQRCKIAPSYGKKIVEVFRDLQKRRQTSRIFESKQGFATLRDLFRWAGRDAVGYQELAENGYMLLAERVRNQDDKMVVKEVIQSVMNVTIDERSMYDLEKPPDEMLSFLGRVVPSTSHLVWTQAIKRLYVLLCRALKFNEPVLLVGETGCGKTSICQVYAEAEGQRLITLNCHQNTETADLIGGLRPLRNRAAVQSSLLQEAVSVLRECGVDEGSLSLNTLEKTLLGTLKGIDLDEAKQARLHGIYQQLQQSRAIFEWNDGPLIDAMNNGHLFLLDEISLADDSVLERLNSVLEPSRTIVLAERGGTDSSQATIHASDPFRLVATMNPGGDYGKKELSPALRNRFTEIWVPPVEDRADLELIVQSLWGSEDLKGYTVPLLDFAEWLCSQVGDKSIMSIRDILAWINFMNSMHKSRRIPPDELFHHGAYMTYLDGLGALPQCSGYSSAGLVELRSKAQHALQQFVPLKQPLESVSSPLDSDSSIEIGSFALHKGPEESIPPPFNFHAPTTLNNAMRLIRACQVPKPILLEGSPGVGKTSLVTALAQLAGHRLHRINLSDQTDLIDLFGSDLPVEGGVPGEFSWKDADFLQALQQGHWVLLDEMNLAPQAVLEGLNAALDHRGTIYIPELNRSFVRHPSFRIFAAQNPINQGGGRKGLPKSFVNRFSKVYVDELTADDLHLVCSQLFPSVETGLITSMIRFNSQLNRAVSVERTFGQDGSPWEFNLRDILRWGSLMADESNQYHPKAYFPAIYQSRFRNQSDKRAAADIFVAAFPNTPIENQTPDWKLSEDRVHIGHSCTPRNNFIARRRPPRMLKRHLSSLESLAHSTNHSWLAILTGSRATGKSSIVRLWANMTGNPLDEISVNSSTDTMDILGSFEQVDLRRSASTLVEALLLCVDLDTKTRSGSENLTQSQHQVRCIHRSLQDSTSDVHSLLSEALNVATTLTQHVPNRHRDYEEIARLISSTLASDNTSKFQWVDGPLVRAMKTGRWVLLDGANLCNPSVLDRLNSLCESNGFLTLSERGFINGAVETIRPHPNFRLFMSVDPHYGELSRAMRNRGIEIAIIAENTADDLQILGQYHRLPHIDFGRHNSLVMADAVKRSIISIGASHVAEVVSTGRTIDQDANLSSLLDDVPNLLNARYRQDILEQWIFVLSRTVHPAIIPYLIRAWQCASPSGFDGVLFSAFLGYMTTNLIPLLENCGDSSPLPHFVDWPLRFHLNHQIRSSMTPDIQQWVRYDQANLAVGLFLHEHNRSLLSGDNNKCSAAIREIKKIACDVLESLTSTSKDVLENCAASSHLAFSTLGNAKGLMTVISAHPFNFSEMQSLSLELLTMLNESPKPFEKLSELVRHLFDSVSLKSGQALHALWGALYEAPLSDQAQHAIDNANSLARKLVCSGKSLALAAHAYLAMCVEALPTPLQLEHENEISKIRLLVDQSSTTAFSKSTLGLPSLDGVSHQSLILELRLLSFGNAQKHTEGTMVRLVQTNLLDQSPLARLIAYRHLLWAKESGQPSCANLFSAQLELLEGLFRIRPITDELSGPSMLLRPLVLRSIVHDCDLGNAQLSNLSTREIEIRHHVNMTLASQYGQPSRKQLLMDTFLTVISTVFFALMPAERRSIPLSLPSKASFSQVLSDTQSKIDPTILEIIRSELLPLVPESFSPHGEASLSSIAENWLSIGVVLCKIMIPDTPVDPAAFANSTTTRLQCRRNDLLTQLELQSTLERLLTGMDENPVTERIRMELSRIESKLEGLPEYPERADVQRVHLYWSEVFQFRDSVISKLEGLRKAIVNGDVDVANREHVMQESLSSFSQRLGIAYPELVDITRILRYSLLCIRLGLHLLVVSKAGLEASDSGKMAVTSSILTFPILEGSFNLVDNLRMRSLSGNDVFQSLLLRLAAVAFQKAEGLSVVQPEILQSLYEHAAGLWRVDRAKEQQRAAEAGSLYRPSKIDYESATDAEIEEAELKEMFPTYEEEEGESGTNTGGKAPPTELVPKTCIPPWVEIHLFLPLGEFHARLELLDSFRRYLSSLSTSEGAQDSSLMSRVSRILSSSYHRHNLVSDSVQKRITDQQILLEKEVAAFIKLASWKDTNVHALKQSAQTTHRQLYKITRKFQALLREPIVQNVETLKDAESISTLLPSPPSLNEKQATLLEGVFQVRYEKYLEVVKSTLSKAVQSRSASLIAKLADEITDQSKALASISISAAEEEQRIRHKKALLVRKRKAWSDLLRELKRGGLSSNLKADTLRQNTDEQWLRELPIIEEGVLQHRTELRRSEHYFFKLCRLLPELRSSVATHHPDLTTKEIQKGLMFLESGVSLAIELRGRLSALLNMSTGISTVMARMHQLQSTNAKPVYARNAGLYTCSLSLMLSKIYSGLNDLSMAAKAAQELDTQMLLPDGLDNLLAAISFSRQSCSRIADVVSASHLSFITSSEVDILTQCETCIKDVKSYISASKNGCERFAFLLAPLEEWLSNQTISPLIISHSPVDLPCDPKALIDRILSSAQSMLGSTRLQKVSDDDDDPGKYILDGASFVREFSHLLNTNGIQSALRALLISISSPKDLRSTLGTVLPYLDVYQHLMENQVAQHIQWTKSLFKLNHVLYSLLQSLCEKGFCQPPDPDDSGKGEDSKEAGTQEGVGVGEGVGEKNVSNEIEEESQVEGLQGQTEENDQPEKHESGDALEMDNDFGGELEDVPDDGSEKEEDDSDDDGQEDFDEALGELDELDENAVDEKMWGDEKGPEDTDRPDQKSNDDHAQQQSDSSEIAAKEGPKDQSKKEQQEKVDGEQQPDVEEEKNDEADDPMEGNEDAADDPKANGAPMDEHVADADTLDLPDDLQLGAEDVEMNDVQEMEDDPSHDEDGDEEMEDATSERGAQDEDTTPPDSKDEPTQAPDGAVEEEDPTDSAVPQEQEETEDDTNPSADSVATPDLSTGDGVDMDEGNQGDTKQPSSSKPNQQGSANGPDSLSDPSKDGAADDDNSAMSAEDNHPMSSKTEPDNQAAGAASQGVQQGQEPSDAHVGPSTDQPRSLGDSLKEISHRFEEILNSEKDHPSEPSTAHDAQPSQVEYLRPEDADHDMQALGPALDEKMANLDQLNIVDNDEVVEDENVAMDVDEVLHHEKHQIPDLAQQHQPPQPQGKDQQKAEKGALLQHALQETDIPIQPEVQKALGEVQRSKDDDYAVEQQLRTWRSSEYPDSGAEAIWRSYESLTQDLAYALCEQLRLILEPTLATRLKGDYRTGKRLNMKKVISYIASDYTKDKIWLRRTRPSQREYQVLISLDDSRSMAESHSIHLAYQTLALISKALNRLESGDIGIAKFGETVDLLHGFDEGAITNQAGTKIVNSFRFTQKATNVLSLLEQSLQILETARERKAMNSASSADLWQLQIIISDGMCQDHQKLRTVLRKAEEQRVMIVFIILDSLHSNPSGAESGGKPPQGSILSMDTAEFTNVNGKMELQLRKYLDTFPFEYYVVLRDVEALPDVLAGTLKQFFERISEE